MAPGLRLLNGRSGKKAFISIIYENDGRRGTLKTNGLAGIQRQKDKKIAPMTQNMLHANA
jgi:hypothetical protein